MSSHGRLEHALDLVRLGQKRDAQQVIANVLHDDPRNAEAWALAAQVDDNRQRALSHLAKVIEFTDSDKMRSWAKEKQIQIRRELDAAPLAAQVQVSSPVPSPASLAPSPRPEPAQKATKICPYCSEEILATAKVCKHCGRNVWASGEERTLLVVRESLWAPSFWLRCFLTVGLYAFAWHQHYLTLTTRQVLIYAGLLSKHERSAPLNRVQDITIRYSLISRMFDYGHIYIETAGGTQTELLVRNVISPQTVKDNILKAINGDFEKVIPIKQPSAVMVTIIGFLVGIFPCVSCVILSGILSR